MIARLAKLLAPEGAAAAAPLPTAPAAPAPAAPAAAPASAPSAPAAPASESYDSPFSEIEAKFKAADEPPAAPAKHQPPAPKAAAAPAKPIPTAADKAPGVPKELRAELDRVKAELKTKSDAESQLQAKIADFERRGKDTEALSGQLGTLQKAMAQKDAELRALKQEASPEFKRKFDEPFNRLAARARGVVEGIQIENAETGAVRNATWDEFSKLYNLSEFVAHKEAKRLFGDDGAAVAMRYYSELHRMDDDRQTALQEERANYAARQQEDDARMVTQRDQINGFWDQANKDLSEKVEDYHDAPDDKELSEMRQKGLAIFDAPPKTLQHKIIKDAHVRQMVGAFHPMKLKLLRVSKERDDLKAELDQLKAPTPGKTGRPGGAAASPGPEEDFETGLRKHMAGVA